MGIHPDCKEELDERLKEHDRRQTARIKACKSEVLDETGTIADQLQKLTALVTTMSDDHKDMKQQLTNLCEVGVAWQNFQGARNTLGYMFGRQTWAFWLLIAAVIYAISHNFNWPTWFAKND